MDKDALKSIIEDAHKLAKADIAPDLVKPAVETIALRLERLVKDGFYVAPEAAREIAQAHKDIMDGKSLNAILANPPFDCKLKMPVISMPGKAAIKYHVEDPELSRFAARCDYGALCIRADRQTRRNDVERRDAGKPKRKYDAKKRAPKLKRGEEGA